MTKMSRQILPSINRRTITYGRSSQADLRITESFTGHFESRFHVSSKHGDLGEFRLRIPGPHNILNATAAIAIGLELDVKVDDIREALAGFTGVERRFQTRGEAPA